MILPGLLEHVFGRYQCIAGLVQIDDEIFIFMISILPLYALM